MTSGRLGFPRPLLNETCNIRITAHNTGSDTLAILEDVVKQMGGGFEFTVADSGIKKLDDFPSSPYVDLENNRLPFDDLSMIADMFGKRTQVANEGQITISTINEYQLKGTDIRRPVIDKLIRQSVFVLEIPLREPMTDMQMNNFIKQSEIKGVYDFEDEHMFIIDTERESLTIESLDDVHKSLIDNGVAYNSIIIACGTKEIQGR